MSARSKKSSKKTKAVDAAFDAKLWKQAEAIVSGYKLLIQKDDEVGGYLGRSVELPMVMADGSTLAKCAAQTLEALTVAVATMLESGEAPPRAAAMDKRTAQINIRVSAEEKMRLEDAAQRLGFRGISDYVRSAALKEAV